MTETSIERVGPAPAICVEHAGAGEFLVFMHGVGGNRGNWRDQLAVFGAHFHAAAWDARGYGESEDYDGALDFLDFTRDLVRVLDRFGVDRAHVAGLSMGGRIALDFAEHHPDRLSTLTLIDTHPGFADLDAATKREFLRARKEPLERGLEPRDIAEPVARGLVGPDAPRAAIDRLIESMSTLRKDSYIKALEATVMTESRLRLEDIRVPTHVIVGDHDKLTPPEIARGIAARVPGARLTVIENAGHLVNIERPEAFNEAALAFLLAHGRAAG